MVWTIQMVNMVQVALRNLYPNQLAHADKLHAAWRLSIHPYPKLGGYSQGLPPTHPNNQSGDPDGIAATNSVWNLINSYLNQFGTRKLWITEVGVSSKKITEQGQKDFFVDLANRVAARYAANDKRIEGWINWGFSDLDPGVHTEGGILPVGQSGPPEAPFFQMGVLKGNDGVSPKPAATALETIYKGIWA